MDLKVWLESIFQKLLQEAHLYGIKYGTNQTFLEMILKN